MKREIHYAILAVVIMVIAYIMGSNSALFKYKEEMYKFPRQYMSEEKLITESDAIVLAEVIEDPEYREAVYTLEVEDILYGILPQTALLAVDSDDPQSIESGTKYVFFLVRDSAKENTYRLINNQQGVFATSDDIFENKQTNMQFTRAELVEKVQALK